MLIQVYPAAQNLDRPVTGSRWQASAAMRMMELLHGTGVRLGLVTNGEQWMLVDAPSRRDDRLHLLVCRAVVRGAASPCAPSARCSGAYRFFGVPDDQTLEALLAASAQDQHEVTDQLGYQVRQAVEILIQAIDRADQDRHGELLAGLGDVTSCTKPR